MNFTILSKMRGTNIGLLVSLFSFLLIQCNLDISQEVEYEMGSLPQEIDFNYHVKPILSDRCYSCHGLMKKVEKQDYV